MNDSLPNTNPEDREPAEKPAETVEEIWKIFDPSLTMNPESPYYIQRQNTALDQLRDQLLSLDARHCFLRGHGGSGKTTELKRLHNDPAIRDRYIPVYLTAQNMGAHALHLTHDAILLEMGLAILDHPTVQEKGVAEKYRTELENWGREIVKTFVKDQSVRAETGAGGNAWLAFFKAQLSARRQWTEEQKIILEPKVLDLIALLNRIAQDVKNQSRKQLLLMVDDLEKGDSPAHKELHQRLFRENCIFLLKPAFSIIYTLPVYFRAEPSPFIENNQIFAFPALRIYSMERKKEEKPALDKEGTGYRVMRAFVEKRLANPNLLDEEALDELLLIGGGLFRETARAIHDAAYWAKLRNESRITLQHSAEVFNKIKKEYQPRIYGKTAVLLNEVMNAGAGWVENVMDLLQSRAVVEYENGDFWLDVRYVLKAYVRKLPPR